MKNLLHIIFAILSLFLSKLFASPCPDSKHEYRIFVDAQHDYVESAGFGDRASNLLMLVTLAKKCRNIKLTMLISDKDEKFKILFNKFDYKSGELYSVKINPLNLAFEFNLHDNNSAGLFDVYVVNYKKPELSDTFVKKFTPDIVVSFSSHGENLIFPEGGDNYRMGWNFRTYYSKNPLYLNLLGLEPRYYYHRKEEKLLTQGLASVVSGMYIPSQNRMSLGVLPSEILASEEDILKRMLLSQLNFDVGSHVSYRNTNIVFAYSYYRESFNQYLKLVNGHAKKNGNKIFLVLHNKKLNSEAVAGFAPTPDVLLESNVQLVPYEKLSFLYSALGYYLSELPGLTTGDGSMSLALTYGKYLPVYELMPWKTPFFEELLNWEYTATGSTEKYIYYNRVLENPAKSAKIVMDNFAFSMIPVPRVNSALPSLVDLFTDLLPVSTNPLSAQKYLESRFPKISYVGERCLSFLEKNAFFKLVEKSQDR